MPEIHAKLPCREDCLRLDYVYGGTVTYRPGETLGPRVLTDYELVFIIEGQVTYIRDEREYAAAPGTILLARPGFHESYRWDPKHETRHAYLHFDLDAIPRNWPEPALWPVVVAKPEPVCAALLQHLVARCGAQPRWPAEKPPREVCCLMKTLLEALFEKNTSPARAAETAARPAPRPDANVPAVAAATGDGVVVALEPDDQTNCEPLRIRQPVSVLALFFRVVSPSADGGAPPTPARRASAQRRVAAGRDAAGVLVSRVRGFNLPLVCVPAFR
jgi:hypothetical protein